RVAEEESTGEVLERELGKNVALANERLAAVPPELRHWEWHYLKRKYDGGIFTLYGHTAAVKSVAFSPDGTRLLTGGGGTVKVWDARTGQPLLELKGHTDTVHGVRCTP